MNMKEKFNFIDIALNPFMFIGVIPFMQINTNLKKSFCSQKQSFWLKMKSVVSYGDKIIKHCTYIYILVHVFNV